MSETTSKTSSIVTKEVQGLRNDQMQMQIWHVIVILVIAFFILKFFIYIKDKDDRHGN